MVNYLPTYLPTHLLTYLPTYLACSMKNVMDRKYRNVNLVSFIKTSLIDDCLLYLIHERNAFNDLLFYLQNILLEE